MLQIGQIKKIQAKIFQAFGMSFTRRTQRHEKIICQKTIKH